MVGTLIYEIDGPDGPTARPLGGMSPDSEELRARSVISIFRLDVPSVALVASPVSTSCW